MSLHFFFLVRGIFWHGFCLIKFKRKTIRVKGAPLNL